jgi:hypothetical protein
MGKRHFLYCTSKRQILVLKLKLHETIYFVVFTQNIKNVGCSRTCHVHTEYLDVCANFFYFFDILKIFFPMVGVYAPMSRIKILKYFIVRLKKYGPVFLVTNVVENRFGFRVYIHSRSRPIHAHRVSRNGTYLFPYNARTVRGFMNSVPCKRAALIRRRSRFRFAGLRAIQLTCTPSV